MDSGERDRGTPRGQGGWAHGLVPGCLGPCPCPCPTAQNTEGSLPLAPSANPKGTCPRVRLGGFLRGDPPAPRHPQAQMDREVGSESLARPAPRPAVGPLDLGPAGGSGGPWQWRRLPLGPIPSHPAAGRWDGETAGPSLITKWGEGGVSRCGISPERQVCCPGRGRPSPPHLGQVCHRPPGAHPCRAACGSRSLGPGGRGGGAGWRPGAPAVHQRVGGPRGRRGRPGAHGLAHPHPHLKFLKRIICELLI